MHGSKVLGESAVSCLMTTPASFSVAAGAAMNLQLIRLSEERERVLVVQVEQCEKDNFQLNDALRQEQKKRFEMEQNREALMEKLGRYRRSQEGDSFSVVCLSVSLFFRPLVSASVLLPRPSVCALPHPQSKSSLLLLAGG